MTIHQLSTRLNQSLERIQQKNMLVVDLPQPERLKKRLLLITDKFEMLAEKAPKSSNIILAFEKSTTQQKLTTRDFKNIAWGLSTRCAEHEKKYLFTDIGEQALNKIISHAPQQISQSLYKALVFSYFSIEKSELLENLDKNWILLRDFIGSQLSHQKIDDLNRKNWLTRVRKNPEIFTKNPFKNLSYDFLNNEQAFSEDISELRIASASWFWTDLIVETVNTACQMNDEDFKSRIDSLINLGKREPIYLNDILKKLLNRYCDSIYAHQPNQQLKMVSTEKMGNPLSDSSPSWNSIPPKTRQMVRSWFVRADLEAFFTTFNTYADTRRFDYWLRFLNQISYTQLILGTNSGRSSRQEHREFRALNNGRFSYLSGGTHTNNSFILQISGVFVVEFSDNGNACYFYKNIPFNNKYKHIDIKALKNKDTSICSLNHRGDWEYNFDAKLAELGIFPDQSTAKPKTPKSTSSTGYQRM